VKVQKQRYEYTTSENDLFGKEISDELGERQWGRLVMNKQVCLLHTCW